MKLRPAVKCFAKEMERVLCENDHKGGWVGCNDLFLKNKLSEEVSELIAELKYLGSEQEDKEKILREAADVANVAMMIADNFGGLRHRRDKENRKDGE